MVEDHEIIAMEFIGSPGIAGKLANFYAYIA
jgi:hypothetical protein